VKGRSPTAEERDWMDEIGKLGCIVCRMHLGMFQPEVSIHHIDGRTKPDAHLKTIPLCALHHQLGGDSGPYIAVHPWKARFEAAYGTQQELRQECERLIGRTSDG